MVKKLLHLIFAFLICISFSMTVHAVTPKVANINDDAQIFSGKGIEEALDIIKETEEKYNNTIDSDYFRRDGLCIALFQKLLLRCIRGMFQSDRYPDGRAGKRIRKLCGDRLLPGRLLCRPLAG